MAIEDREKEAFLSRWSRLKREQEAQESAPPARAEESPAPPLPPLEQLTPQSDFAPFMHPKVADALRRVALKKLFADPRFNVPDLNEAFSGDWTGGEPITADLLKTLNQARSVLFREDETAKAPAQEAAQGPHAQQAPEDKEPDGPGRKDS